MTHYSHKKRAVALREQGYSYNLILEQVPVSKGTLSRWLKDVPYQPNQTVKERVGRSRTAAGLRKHELKLQSYQQARELARKDIESVTDHELFYTGLGLYAGEGEKNDTVGIINADPQIICFSIKWLMHCYGLAIENFSIAIHIYPNISEQKAKDYWSDITGIPLQQFKKTQVDSRKGKRMGKRGLLPYGTAHVRVKSNGKKEFGVLLSRRIEATISLVLSNNKKRV